MFQKPIYTLYVVLAGILASCGLTYVPVKTPEMLQAERRSAIQQRLNEDFSSKGLSYTSLGFGQTVVVKPASYYKLDSLYAIKYELEKKSQTDKDLEERIAYQKLMAEQDSTPVYYIEDHVFAIKEQEKTECFHADVYVSKSNKVETMEILESALVPVRLYDYYKAYALQVSFLYPDSYPDEAEIAFYDFYGQKLNSLSGKERDEFMQFMLGLMRIANRGTSLDKAYLMKEMTRFYTQGTSRNYLEEKFSRMEEFFNERNETAYYLIEYTYSTRNESNVYQKVSYRLELDPYLQLIEMKKID